MSDLTQPRPAVAFAAGLRRFTGTSVFWPLVILAAFIIFNAIATPGFLSIEIKDGHLSGYLVDIANRSTHIMVIAIGLTLVIATKGIDVSVGSIVAISGAMAAFLIGGTLQMNNGVEEYISNLPMGLAIFIALFTALGCGLWNGALVSQLKMQPIVATLILYVAGRGIAQLITNGQIITIYYKPYFFIGNGFIGGVPVSIFITLGVLLVALLITRRTALGLFIESIGVNPKASTYAGVKSSVILVMVYGFCGLCAGISGLLVSSNVKSADGNNAGNMFELDAILAVVIGGTSLNGGRFFLVGSVIGALVIQSLTTTIYARGVAPEITMVVKAAVVFVLCLIQSTSFRKAVMNPFTKRRIA